MTNVNWRQTNFNVNGLIMLLETYTKLKCVDIKCRLYGEDVLTEAEKEQIGKAVADKSFRQSSVV